MAINKNAIIANPDTGILKISEYKLLFTISHDNPALTSQKLLSSE